MQHRKSCLAIPLQDSFMEEVRPGLWGHEILICNLHDSLHVKINKSYCLPAYSSQKQLLLPLYVMGTIPPAFIQSKVVNT